MYCHKVQKWIYLMKLSATATLHHKSFCLDKIEKNLHQNHVFLRKGPRLYLKKIKSTKHQRREKMQLLNDPSLSQNGFVIFFSKQTLWWINTRRGVQYSAEGVSVETAVKHLRTYGCCRAQATDRVILWTTTWARKLKLLCFKLVLLEVNHNLWGNLYLYK